MALRLLALLAALIPAMARGGEEAERPRREAFLEARRKARAWLDGLEIDCADLQRRGIKGKKKLAEILDIYFDLHRLGAGPEEKKAIRERVEALAAQTRRPEYHNLSTCSEAELVQNSMSYLRTAWILSRFGLDIGGYREEIRAAQPRLDEHLLRRGPWQRAMFAGYYDRFGLARPAILQEASPGKGSFPGGVVERRLPARSFTDNEAYDLTHEVFVAFDYGHSPRQDRFSAADLDHLRSTLPVLARRYVAARNHDLAAEILSSMTYLGLHTLPEHGSTAEFLLASQNPDGSWGAYEEHRKTWGRWLDQHVYLHTTMVALQALLEVHEGPWNPR